MFGASSTSCVTLPAAHDARRRGGDRVRCRLFPRPLCVFVLPPLAGECFQHVRLVRRRGVRVGTPHHHSACECISRFHVQCLDPATHYCHACRNVPCSAARRQTLSTSAAPRGVLVRSASLRDELKERIAQAGLENQEAAVAFFENLGVGADALRALFSTSTAVRLAQLSGHVVPYPVDYWPRLRADLYRGAPDQLFV